jgi:HPr kinase/phosphorylase
VAGQGKISGPEETILHASCVAFKGQGLLMLGASGRGKSGLALNLMALGAELVADDRVALTRVGQSIIASAPENISGLIEARGIGLLRAATFGPVPLAFVVDLNQTEAERMPPIHQTVLLGVSLGLLFKVDAPHFAAALIQMMKEGRQPEP